MAGPTWTRSAERGPHVSVLLTVYNLERFVHDAVDSLGRQSFRDFEVVVADDGSTDATIEILEKNPHGLSQRLVTGPNVGVGANRARAVEMCRGQLIAFLDGDDRLRPDHLRSAAAALSTYPEAALFYCDRILIDESGTELGRALVQKDLDEGQRWVADPTVLLSWNYIGCSGVVVRRSALAAVGGIDPAMKAESDIWFRIACSFPIYYASTATVEYRVRSDGLYSDAEDILRWRLALYEKHAALVGARRPELTASAHLRTAYRQLWPTPTPESVALARRNIGRAFRLRPRSIFGRRELAMVICAGLGKLHVLAVRRYGAWLASRGLKTHLQRFLRIRR